MVFLAMTIKTVIFRYPQRGEALLAPAASLFAFTSLRGTLPGNPPFGMTEIKSPLHLLLIFRTIQAFSWVRYLIQVTPIYLFPHRGCRQLCKPSMSVHSCILGKNLFFSFQKSSKQRLSFQKNRQLLLLASTSSVIRLQWKHS
jgi:hypothetical protein